jgi:hypothetical protein
MVFCGRLGEYFNRVGRRRPSREVEAALLGGRSSGQVIPPKLSRRLAGQPAFSYGPREFWEKDAPAD